MTDASFERFVRESHAKSLRLAYAYLGDWEEARDAVQEAFVKAHGAIGKIRDEAALPGWFGRILSNHLKDCLRRRKLRNLWGRLFGPGEEHRGEESPDVVPTPESGAMNAALRGELLAAVRSLPERQREVFRLKAVGELTFREIAQALSISEGAAKTHHQRAITRLKDALGQWGDER